jgi:predicted GIY-YIG superfamily endonuclease
MWYIYVLKMADGERYVGSTNDLKRRLKEHNGGKSLSSKWRLPVKLEAYIAVQTEGVARQLEKYLKTSSGKATLRKRILPVEAKA